MRRRLAALSLYRIDLDRWAVVYLVGSGFYPQLNPAVTPHPWWHLGLHLLLALAIWFVPPLLRCSPHRVLRFLGEVYLPFLFPFFYNEMRALGIVFHGFHDSFDPWLIRLEEHLFGLQPSLAWSRAWPWPWFHELMEFAYFGYYLVSPLTIWLIMSDRSRPSPQRWQSLRDYIRDLGAVMLICFTLYTFFPAWGPKYFRTGPIPVGGWLFTAVMRYIHAHGAILGAAFPSSHVAGTMIGWWHIWKNFPRHRWWMTLFFVLLSAATVYCRYHYVVDVMGGLLLGTLVIWLGERLGEKGRRAPGTGRPLPARTASA